MNPRANAKDDGEEEQALGVIPEMLLGKSNKIATFAGNPGAEERNKPNPADKHGKKMERL